MAYALQTFGSGQVLTKGQAQQIEDNIRDHIHSQGGVGASGLNWAVSSAVASFLAVQSMTSQLVEVSGDFTITLDNPATLGRGWGQTYVNIGSGRVVLAPTSGLIDETSQFVLTPRAQVNALSDGANIKLFGQTRGWFPLWKKQITTSTQFLVVDKMFPGDFSLYQIEMEDIVVASGADIMTSFVSETSGSTFTTAGYECDAGAIPSMQLSHNTNINSNQFLRGYVTFSNRAVVGDDLYFDTHFISRGAAGALNPVALDGRHVAAPVTNIINAMKIMPGSKGFMIAGVVTLLGLR